MKFVTGVFLICLLATPAFSSRADAQAMLSATSSGHGHGAKTSGTKRKPSKKTASATKSTLLNGPTGAGKPGTGGPGATAGTNSNGTNGPNGPANH